MVVAALAATLITTAQAPSGALTAPAAAAAAPVGTVAEVAPDPVLEPGGDDLERWQVTDLGDGRYDVSWTSPSRLPLTSDRPTIGGPGLVFGPPTLDPDGRTVRAVVTAEVAPDPAALDVVLSGDRLDERGRDALAGAGGDAVAGVRTDVLAATDPGLPGAFATTTSDYELDPVKLPGMKQPIEMVGHVVEPSADAATGARPLVLFLHGRHGVCYDPDDRRGYTRKWPCVAPFAEIPSHLGYDYVQQVLASQGYATVSVRVNGINAQDFRLDDGGAGARATIVARHLDHWVGLAAAHQVDLDQVVLVGHSRGGEGINRASVQILPSAPYTVVGQVLLAPTDFAAQSAPYVPTVTVLPYCDGDVSDIQGQQFTDTGRDLVDDDTSLKSSVLVMGANHNFFNTEWTPRLAAAPANDDWYGRDEAPCGRRHPDRLSAREQRAVGTAYVAGAVALFTGDDATLPLYDGSAVTVASIGDADVRTHALGGGRSLRRPGIEATPSLASGAGTRLCRGIAAYSGGSFAICRSNSRSLITPHWGYQGSAVPVRQFFEMGWTSAGARGGLRFDDPLDLSTGRLELRTIVDPRRGPVDLRVRLSDSTGAATTLTPDNVTDDGHTLEPLLVDDYLTKLWAQALLVDATTADPGDGVDLTDIVRVELVGLSDRGRVWVADLSSAPDDLAPVPDVRLPQLRIGDLRMPEGDRPAVRTARVPFEVVGDLTGPARFLVQTTGETRGSRQRFAVDLAPGQKSGTIPVHFAADDVAGYPQRADVAAWALSGVITDDYLGVLRVEDDDPAPVLSVRLASRRVVEGDPIVYVATIAAPASYTVFLSGLVVAGPGQDLRGDDLRARWITRHSDPDRTRLPLHKVGASVYGDIPSGERRVVLRIPTRRDGRAEGKEKLTVRFDTDAEGESLVRTVTVVDAR